MTPRRRNLAAAYGAGTLACLMAATLGGAALLLLWPAVSLALVAIAYGGQGADLFHKRANGRHPLLGCVLLAPYRAGAWLAQRRNARRLPTRGEVFAGLVLGVNPGLRPVNGPVLDLCAELSARPAPQRQYRSVPMLDQVAPSTHALNRAMQALHELHNEGVVLIHCALGVGRSAAVAVAWMLETSQASSVAEALELVRRMRPQAVFPAETVTALKSWWAARRAMPTLSHTPPVGPH